MVDGLHYYLVLESCKEQLSRSSKVTFKSLVSIHEVNSR